MNKLSEERISFTALYIGQTVIKNTLTGRYIQNSPNMWRLMSDDPKCIFRLELKNLRLLTDENLFMIFYKIHNIKIGAHNSKIKRDKDLIHITHLDASINHERHVCINCDYGTFNCNTRFYPMDGDEDQETIKYKVNIGEIQMTSMVIPWTVVDYLRSEGFALPFNDKGIRDLENQGFFYYDDMSTPDRKFDNLKNNPRIPESVINSAIGDGEYYNHMKYQKIAIGIICDNIEVHQLSMKKVIDLKTNTNRSEKLMKEYKKDANESYNRTIRDYENCLKNEKRLLSMLNRGLAVINYLHGQNPTRALSDFFKKHERNSVIVIPNIKEMDNESKIREFVYEV